ncbi:AraC family transcriptional regulator [Burkholderia multivorans]|uniref:AraC family transcriptional regulator n=1 Tax=Burkholderia multivorans TaxID=87883 RepID=UPI000CFF9E33|nr:AraC family transcriptional regulator [Burkholderia multivorans]PRE75820.1 AraC family transcriptional regulator [Burkholderia multivorans]
MRNQPTMRDVCAIGRDGRRVAWPLPAQWKKQSAAPLFAGVATDRYTACASEIIDVETTGPIFGLHLRPPAAIEMRIDDSGWTPYTVRAPLAYVPPGFAFSSRWSSDIEWITLHFDPSWLARAGLHAGGQTMPTVPHLDVNDDLLMQIVRSIHEDAVAGAPLGPTYVETLGAAALRRMAYLESTRQAREYTHARSMHAAVEYIRDNFREPLTLVALAEAVGYPGDLYAFIRSFKKAHGVTPHQYIIETRLQAARDLIERGRSDVTEAALACGFSTTSHFSATFRKRWGISPSELKPRSASVRRAARTESTDR